MKYRNNKIKVEHSIISGVKDKLDRLSKLIEIKAIVPGRIKPIKGNYPNPTIELKYFTLNGFKCIAKSGRAAQEVFISSTSREGIENFLKKL